MQVPKRKKHKKISKTPILKSAFPAKRSFKNKLELTPPLRRCLSKIAMLLVGLCLLSVIPGCGSGGGGTTTPTPASLTLEQRIWTARAEALANGCTVVDININYSLLAGGENLYGGNVVSKQGDNAGVIETVPSNLTIKCGNQIHNFVFADEAEQSDNVKKANETPVGDINAFFKTDKNTEEDIATFVKEKIDSTALCRFSTYPAFGGTIDDDATETLSVAASGIDCETPKWYINDNSVSYSEGNSLVVSINNLLSGENGITIKVTNPAGTNSFYLKRIQGPATNDPATAIQVAVTPTEVHATTPSMTGSEIVTDIDESVIVREWYDNDVLMLTGATAYEGPFVPGHKIKYKATADDAVSDSVEIIVIDSPATAVKVSISPTDIYTTTPNVTGSEVVTDTDGGTSLVREWYVNNILKGSDASYAGPFVKGDIVKYRVIADGAFEDTVQKTVKDSACTMQVTNLKDSYKARDDSVSINVLVSDIDGDNFTPSASGFPSNVLVTPSLNNLDTSGTTSETDGDCADGYCIYPVTVTAGTVGSGGCQTTFNLKVLKYQGLPPE